MSWLTDLSLIHYLLLVVIIAFAGLVHGTMGIGFPMVATPLITVFMDVRSAILFTLLPTVMVNVASIWLSGNYQNIFRQYWWLFFAALIGALIGSYLLVIFDPSPFRLVLAFLIFLFLVTTFSDRLSNPWVSADNYLVMAAFGFVAGVSAGTTNVMVAVLVIYLLGIGLKRLEMIPILNTCFLLDKTAQIGVLGLEGFVSSMLVYQTIPLSMVALAALLMGRRIGKKMGMETYRMILYGLLFVLACTLIMQFIVET
ncbi:MAG: TSUP family transporter [Gammaproteobacteria bacterium]|nr:TSUP family transporter [Gammaproteobacteria bacterium]